VTREREITGGEILPLRIKKNKEELKMKRKTICKKAGDLLIAMMLFTSFLALMVAPTIADEPQVDNTRIGFDINMSYAIVNQSFNVTLWGNPDSDEVMDSWAVGSFEFNQTSTHLARVTHSTIGGFWDTGFDYNGTMLNKWDVLKDAQAFTMTPADENRTLLRVDMLALSPGLLWINLTDVQAADGGVFVHVVTFNGSMMIYPARPFSFTATSYNTTQINLSFTQGAGDDKIVVCASTSTYPPNAQTGVIYNGTGTNFSHDGLDPDTRWYYSAWGYNTTAGMLSHDNATATARTQSLHNFSFQHENPTNGSENQTGTAYNYNVSVNVTVNNNGSNNYNWWINTTNGDAWHGTNRTYNTSTPVQHMAGLSHNTWYWWNVTVKDGMGDRSQANYTFKTGNGGGQHPNATSPNPANASTDIDTTLNYMACTVTDYDADPMNVSFYWLNGTLIGTDTNVANGTVASITPSLSLDYATTYYWYVNVTDGNVNNTQRKLWHFTTGNATLTISKAVGVSGRVPWGNTKINYFINVTNNAANLTNVYVNETYDSDFSYLTASPAPDSGTNKWVISTLNESETWELVITGFLKNDTANGSSIINTVTADNQHVNTSTARNYLNLSFTVTKRANLTSIRWNTSYIQYWVNVSNTGDIPIHNLSVYDTFPSNMTFASANYPGTSTFWLSTLNSSQTKYLIINVTTSWKDTSEKLVNATRYYNNVTVNGTEAGDVNATSYLYCGAQTTRLKITYQVEVTDVTGIGNSVLSIVGVILIIASIMLIVAVVYKSGYLGGGG